jgi:long-subunit fatty acid transport protein
VGAIKATLPLGASNGSIPPGFYALSGLGPAPVGTKAAVKPGTQLFPGGGGITLPGKLTLGVRQRLNQIFTWEADLRYILGSQAQLPGYPSSVYPGVGPAAGSGESTAFRSGFGISLMGELNIGKNWVMRLGASLDPALLPSTQVEPLVGGAKSSGLSGGVGYKAFGGEVSLGYQFRQSQDVDVKNLDGTWKSTGYSTNAGSATRVEGMGHLWSVGYKRSF